MIYALLKKSGLIIPVEIHDHDPPKSPAPYVPKHSPEEYIRFLSGKSFSFGENPVPSRKQKWSFFSVVSQHVYGDSLEECLDIAIGIFESGRYQGLGV